MIQIYNQGDHVHIGFCPWLTPMRIGLGLELGFGLGLGLGFFYFLFFNLF